MLPSLPPLALVDRDDFRNWKLYDPNVEDTFKAYDKSLRPLFKHYAAMDYDGLTQRGELLNLDEWNRMLADCELFDAGRHLHEALDKLLQLVVERTTGDVTLPITAKILNKRKDGRENAR